MVARVNEGRPHAWAAFSSRRRNQLRPLPSAIGAAKPTGQHGASTSLPYHAEVNIFGLLNADDARAGA